jgi:pimeloyl-ACP methyl ester carboxylesterase
VSSFTTEVGDFRTPDGVRLRYTRRTAGRPRAILVTPGILMHRESDEHQLLAGRLTEQADVVTLDVRGHGDSGGFFTWGVREPQDLASLAAFLRARHRYVSLGGLGFSFGGLHTAVAAARAQPFDAVALVGAPHRLFILDHNFLTAGFVRGLPLALRRRRRFTRLWPVPPGLPPTPSHLVGRIAPVPLLIVHGADDWLIPPAHARRLYAAAGEPRELALIPGGLHAENMLADRPEALLALLLRFFARTLSPS